MASGLEAAKPAIRELCRAQSELAAVAAKPVAEFPVFLDYQDDVYTAVAEVARGEVAEALKIAGKADREEALDRVKAKVARAARRRSSRAARRRSARRSAR